MIVATGVNSSEPLALNDAHWNFLGGFSLFVLLSVLSLNSFLFFNIVRKRLYLVAFNVYIINLLITNTCFVLIENPLEIISNIYPVWWLGNPTCTLFLYSEYVLTAAVYHCHVLISVNRLWAITFPIHYRHHHSRRVAVLLCLAVLVYVHLCILPGLIMDAMFYRLPPEKTNCLLNRRAQRGWAMTVNLLNYDGPLVFAPVAYIVVWYKRGQRSRIKTELGNGALNRLAARKLLDSVETQDLDSRDPDHLQKIVRKESQHGFLILTLLTCSMVINWTPSQTYYTAVFFTDADLGTLYQIGVTMWALQAVIDPILFSLALKDFRAAVGELFRREKSLQLTAICRGHPITCLETQAVRVAADGSL